MFTFCLCSLSWGRSAGGGGRTYSCRVSVFECEVSSEPSAAPLVRGVSVSFRVIVLHSAEWPCIFARQIRGPVIATLCICRFCLTYADLEFHLVAFVYREHSFYG